MKPLCDSTTDYVIYAYESEFTDANSIVYYLVSSVVHFLTQAANPAHILLLQVWDRTRSMHWVNEAVDVCHAYLITAHFLFSIQRCHLVNRSVCEYDVMCAAVRCHPTAPEMTMLTGPPELLFHCKCRNNRAT